MDKKLKIRLQNTGFAIIGAGILSLLIGYSDYLDLVSLEGVKLYFVILVFWLGNGMFVLALVSGFSTRFKDPSLTLPQMYWAVSTTIIFMCITYIEPTPFYFLLFTTLLFGTLRLTPKEFGIFGLYSISSVAGFTFYQYYRIPNSNPVWLFSVWCTFAFSVYVSSVMCQSRAIIRTRLKKQNIQLAQALEAKSLFLANMSHEIRTPINGVIGMLSILKRSPLNRQQQRQMALAELSADGLLGIINDILDFSKIEANKIEIELVEGDIARHLAEILQSMGQPAQKKDLELIFEGAGLKHRNVKYDPVRFQQIITNLVGNAIKFTASGEIVVTAWTQFIESDRGSFFCEIHDTGIGIESDKQERIFDSFSQVDLSTTREYGGTGLGLSITKHLVELMDGEIQVESAPNIGTTFKLSLPITLLSASAADQEVMIDKLILEDGALIISPNETLCTTLVKLLIRWSINADYVCSEVAGLTQLALKGNTAQNPYAIIFIDADIGCIAAERLIDRINQCSRRQIRIVIFTRIANQSEIPDSVMQECEFHILKPISFETLRECLTKSYTFNEVNVGRPINPSLSTKANTQKKCVPADINKPKLNDILLVEDDRINQEVVIGLLEDDHLQCDIANNGQEAIELLKKRSSSIPYKLIFMDCQMPVLDGYETAISIRQGDAGDVYKDIPIVAMTANVETSDRQRCFDSGMNDYISKPISVVVVEKALQNWLWNPKV